MSEILSSEREVSMSSEENDILQRSNKKFKRQIEDVQCDGDMDIRPSVQPKDGKKSYSQMAQSYGKSVNPLFEGDDGDGEDISDDDGMCVTEDEDEDCPLISLTKEDKRRIRGPWRNAIIIKLFDRKLGYEVLMRRLKFKWNLKGNIALTDVGHAFYVVRFTSYEDYEFVMTQGPRMIGDSYLTIRKWVPNFIADEAPMRHLTAWVRIPNLSVEYFDKQILHKIGAKIGKVIKIDRNTESMDRGQYVRFCIEVDLTKPLLSKFKLNGRVWKIQYEGLKMVCFKCGHLGHKEENCGKVQDKSGQDGGNEGRVDVCLPGAPHVQRHHPEEVSKYGDWMLVSRPSRKYSPKFNDDKRGKDPIPIMGSKGGSVLASSSKVQPSSSLPVEAGKITGSRFGVLENASVETSTEDQSPDNQARDGPVMESTQGVFPVKEVSRVEVLGVVGENSGEKNATLEGAKSVEQISKDMEVVKEGKIGEAASRRLSLEKLSLYSKDKDLKKIGIRASGNSLRVNVEKSSRGPHPRTPKFKKGSSRKSAAHLSVGKENIPVLGQVAFGLGREKVSPPLSAFEDVGLGKAKPPDNVGIPHTADSGVLCGATERGSVSDCCTPIGKSGSIGDQLLLAPGKQCAILNGDSRTTIHHRRSDEGVEGDVSCNDV